MREGSHISHESYLKERGDNCLKLDLIDERYLAEIADRKRVLKFCRRHGDINSRVFHQNQFVNQEVKRGLYNMSVYLKITKKTQNQIKTKKKIF